MVTFKTPLVSGILIKRYKRFLADISLDSGDIVTVHCPNPGSMKGLATEGEKVWLEKNVNPRAKLSYGWRLSELKDKSFVVIDTTLANTGSPWVIGAAIPNFGQMPYNAIMAPWQDIHTGVAGSIFYGTTGVAPNRIFNCAFLPIDDWRSFSEVMFLLRVTTCQFYHSPIIPELIHRPTYPQALELQSLEY